MHEERNPMTTLREAAQQALEALEHATPTTDWSYMITALRAALAQQAEPVAWLQPKTVDGHLRPDLGYETCSRDDYVAFPAYTAPPQRKPLTEEEIERIGMKHVTLREVIRAVERAHGIKE